MGHHLGFGDMEARRAAYLTLAATASLIYGFYFMTYNLRPSLSPRPCGTGCDVENSPHFVIHTPVCVIPDFAPTDPAIAEYIGTEDETVVCSTLRPLTDTDRLMLRVYKERVEEYGLTWESINCSYQGIRRIQQDPNRYDWNCDKISKLKENKIPINSNTPILEDGILVKCLDVNNMTVIYKNVHYFLQPDRVHKKRLRFEEYEERQSRENKLSVIIMGTDAVSRGNLKRSMPKTFQYLTHSLRAIDLQGFNKVGDNTDPNLIAALMGLTTEEFNKHPCHPKKSSKLDDCPLIWKEFSEEGYATAYGEDAPWMGVFHYTQIGFVKEPTDYYNRPYFFVSEREISHNADLGMSNGKLCQGNKLSMGVIHEYSLAVAETLEDLPYFGFYWTASLTHDYLTMAKAADEPSLWYLQQLKAKGYFNHTILFFISDHGQRWGSFRSTYAGMLEERLPYVMIVFPPWFEDKYPEAWHNLRTNTRRLTSTFDIHATLIDILKQAYEDLSVEPRVSSHGQSLFREVPLRRTCQDASVSDHYCACQSMSQLDAGDQRLKTVAEFIVRTLNSGLLAFPECAQLQLVRILRGQMGTATNSTSPKKQESVSVTYSVAFVTNPGGAELEGTVKYHSRQYQIVSDVSRINQYGSDSHCITDQLYRKYCYCRDLM
ncbi:uncharacterized protein [Cherax quadricarinatus]|uniref:uncharacterized protein isoform X2 n=1 Tax=Cherax quadricarinatus TaxID=27406 RepID=UPI0023780809|nr:uncharacterized protein LOC128703436 isoform X2 [Cherax quadricarinatus]